MSDNKTVGLLSPGAMGSVVGRVLIEHGVTVLTCLEDRGPATRERAREAGIEDVAFDRGGYKYHGRVAALADAARDAGLEF